MELKKIYLPLQEALSQQGLTKPSVLQFESWSSLKSGVDCVLVAPNNAGKSTALCMLLVQKLQKAEGESTRAILLVNAKEAVLEAVEMLQNMAQYTDLRVYGVHDKGDIDYDKNQISLGNDILVGTPSKINILFSGAGFNLNTVRIFAIDDADVILQHRNEPYIQRIFVSMRRAQVLVSAAEQSARLVFFIEKITDEALFFELGTDEA